MAIRHNGFESLLYSLFGFIKGFHFVFFSSSAS